MEDTLTSYFANEGDFCFNYNNCVFQFVSMFDNNNFKSESFYLHSIHAIKLIQDIDIMMLVQLGY